MSRAKLLVAILFCLTTPIARALEMRELVARADLKFDAPARRSEEGMPIGNGRMASLVWTTPQAIKLQINRDDVFPIDSSSASFPRAGSDYSNACAFVDVNLVDFGADVFAGKEFSQHLSVYDGVMTIRGQGITARLVASQSRDLFAIGIDDQRAQPTAANIDLRMLRFSTQSPTTAPARGNIVRTGEHNAISRLDIRDGRILLNQEFREKDHYCGSSVAAAVIGRDSTAWYLNESTVRLSTAPGKGKYTILISSAASFDPKEDVVAMAHSAMGTSGSFENVLGESARWWQDFWSRGYISMHSDDGVADTIEKHYTYFLYVMSTCSRGAYMPRFGGLLFYTNGDARAWGSQFWWANQSCYYNGLEAANRHELMEPLFSMYSRMYDNCATAARQQWGSQGIWIAETIPFEGFDPLPDDIAAEMRELYLLRKPWNERSQRFKDFASAISSHGSRWNWMAQGGKWENGQWVRDEKGFSPFGHVTHIFGTTAKIALLYWHRYEMTQDTHWLRERAYPMLKGTVEFYRNFPNLKKESDGKYHIHHTNSNEPAWGVKDSDEDMAAMRGTIGPLIRASEILNVDADMRPVWREFLENLAPPPTSDLPDALRSENYDGPRVWVKGCKPAIKPGGMLPDANTLPHWNFELCTLECDDPAMKQIASATLDSYLRRGGNSDAPISVLSRLPIAAAQMGRADAFENLVVRQLGKPATDEQLGERSAGMMRNRLSLREGVGATECERLGRIAEALHNALLQSVPPAPGKDPIIRVFPAWPKKWDASFKLLARGGFVVSASMRSGQIESVQIEPRAGGELRIRNPWPGRKVKGPVGERLEGDLLKLQTTKGQVIALAPEDAK